QRRGVVHPDRDPVAEAWIFVGGGLLATMDSRLGGLLGDDLQRVRESPRAWMTGSPASSRNKKGGPPAGAPGALLSWVPPGCGSRGCPFGQAVRRFGVPKVPWVCGPPGSSAFRLWRSPCTRPWRRVGARCAHSRSDLRGCQVTRSSDSRFLL